MLVSHEHRFIFVKTRKTASTSVETALSAFLGPADIATLQGGCGPQNIEIPMTRWRAHELYLKARTGRVVFYNHMPGPRIKRLLPREWRDYYTFTIVRNPYDAAISAYSAARRRRRVSSMSLSEFLASRELLVFSNWPMYAVGDRVIVDEVLRYERLEDELDRVRSRLGLPAFTLPRSANSQMRTDRRPYQEVLSTEDRARIDSVSSRELAYFQYEF